MKPIAKYVGRPYEEFNCLDLAREFYKDFFGLEIKHYYEGDKPSDIDAAALIKTNKGDFVKVEKPEFGDLILIRLMGIECHIGVMLEGGKFLHSAKRIGSIVDRMERYSNHIVGFYRHREKA